MGYLKKIYESKYIFIIHFIVSILTSVSIFKVIYYYKYVKYLRINNIILVSIYSVILLSVITYYLYFHRKKLEKIFLCLMMPIGMLYLIFLIPNFVPDEEPHIFRAYDISQGNLITKLDDERQQKMMMPTHLLENNILIMTDYEKLYNALGEKTDYAIKEQAASAASSYHPVLYAFSSIGFLIARIFNLNIILAVYIARICNYIFLLIVGYTCIRIIPAGKLVAFTLLFSPMLIHQAMSVSADSVINSTVILFICYNIYLLFTKKVLDKKDKIIYLIMSIVVALSKYVYFPIVGICVLLFSKHLKSKKDKLQAIGIVLISGIALIIWYMIGSSYEGYSEHILENNINQSMQIKYILTNPFSYILVILSTLKQQLEILLYTFAGSNLGWLDIGVSMIAIKTYLFILVISPFLEDNKYSLKLKQKIIYLAIFILIIILIFTAMYLVWTPIGAKSILGLQGRYFIPIALLFLLALIKKDKFIQFKYTYEVYFMILGIVNLTAISSIIRHLM